MEKPVICEYDNGVALLTLNRPARSNAITQDLLIHLYNYLEMIVKDDNIRAVIITGKGKSFCSGLDLGVLDKDNFFDPRNDGLDFPDIISACKKPVIGAINGPAITGGLELALNLDFLIASERAFFSDTHARVGIHPGWGMSQLLQQAIGARMAKQVSLTCQPITAEQALRLGLVNEVVPHDELLPRAKEIAGYIFEGKPEMVSLMMDLIEYRNHTTLNGAYFHERTGFRKFLGEFQK
ncbi:enoyl-CoA hydratase [Desulfosarcina sp. BuS5]|uniref:enoyl-CoA hydratase n=1 Tax=Desulfosarcina sp. BuS5 TaxID=933262 RepID=UPI000485C354|nr:enoyl-CoA hydratase [Desulfosarcina sp. BuS5]WDN89553.1 enoyl-CoA hydratase [Desulfosarcina sp. BuS5]